MIRTEVFAIAPSATAAMLAQRWLGRRWFLFILPAGALVAGLADWRWLIVALVMVFVLWPMALFFVWIDAALRPEAVRSAQPHLVEFGPDGLRVVYEEREGYRTPPAEWHAWTAVAEVEECGKLLVHRMCDGRCVYVPLSCAEPGEWAQIRRWRDEA